MTAAMAGIVVPDNIADESLPACTPTASAPTSPRPLHVVEPGHVALATRTGDNSLAFQQGR